MANHSTEDAFDALLLVSFGGPEGPDDVVPFLQNVTRGRGIPDERLREVGQHYFHFDGVSPINEQNREFLAKPCATSCRAKGSTCRSTGATATGAPTSSTRCSEMRARRGQAGVGLLHLRLLVVQRVPSVPREPGGGARRGRRRRRRRSSGSGRTSTTPVSSTPSSTRRSDAVRRLERGRAVAGAAGLHHALDPDVDGRQQRTGNGAARWLVRAAAPRGGRLRRVAGRARRRASTCRGTSSTSRAAVHRTSRGSSRTSTPHLRDLAADGCTTAVVVPIGFVSDHMEVLWDLDTQARATADEVGLPMVRVATPGTDPRMVAMVGELVRERLDGVPPERRARVGALAASPDRCAAGCCPNPRSPLPAVAGSDPVPAP